MFYFEILLVARTQRKTLLNVLLVTIAGAFILVCTASNMTSLSINAFDASLKFSLRIHTFI